MVRDLLFILSCVGCAESYSGNANNSCILFKKSMKNLKFREGAAVLGTKIYIYLDITIVTLFYFDLDKMML